MYHARAAAGNYKITSYAVARGICKAFGDDIATIIQYNKATAAGLLEKCGEGGCGYLYQNTANKRAGFFPVKDPGCGDDRNATDCPSDPTESENKGYDVYCFGNADNGELDDKIAGVSSIDESSKS